MSSHDSFIYSDEYGERITVISITPHHPPSSSSASTQSGSSLAKSNNSLRKSSLKQSSKYSDSSTYKSAYGSSNRHQRQREQSDESNFEEYQIEGGMNISRKISRCNNDVLIFCVDIEREIHRKSPEDDHQEDRYHGQYSSENRRSLNTQNKTEIFKVFPASRTIADDGNSTLRKAGSKIATNGSLNMNKKASSPVRQASVLQSWQDDNTLNEEVVDDIDSEENEHYATLSEQHHYSTLRKSNNSSSSRHQRNPRTNQLSHFSQFSRLPPGRKCKIIFDVIIHK